LSIGLAPTSDRGSIGPSERRAMMQPRRSYEATTSDNSTISLP
jgi:hypothetical protein